jgi:hypothetical protein
MDSVTRRHEQEMREKDETISELLESMRLFGKDRWTYCPLCGEELLVFSKECEGCGW